MSSTYNDLVSTVVEKLQSLRESEDSALEYVYNRVGTENNGWVDGITPLNSANLNKSDLALYLLLNGDSGYVKKIQTVLNSEIDARRLDFSNLLTKIYELDVDLTNTINSEIDARDEADNAISAELTDVATTLSNINQNISSLNSSKSNVDHKHNYEELQNTPDLSVYATKSEIPKKVSSLDNDSDYASKSEVTDAINDAINDLEFPEIDADLSNYYTKSEVNAMLPDTSNFIQEDDTVVLFCGSSTTVTDI